MPLSYKDFKKMIKAEGCEILEKNQHNSEIRYQGMFASGFARGHGKGQKRDEVKDCYVRNFKNRIQKIKEASHE